MAVFSASLGSYFAFLLDLLVDGIQPAETAGTDVPLAG